MVPPFFIFLLTYVIPSYTDPPHILLLFYDVLSYTKFCQHMVAIKKKQKNKVSNIFCTQNAPFALKKLYFLVY